MFVSPVSTVFTPPPGLPSDPLSTALRFTAASSQYMHRTFSTTSAGFWTLSMWVKRVGLGTHQALFGANYANVAFYPGNQYGVYGGAAGDVAVNISSATFTSTTLWHNITWYSRTAGAAPAPKFQTNELNNNGAWSLTMLFSDPGLNSAITHFLGIVPGGAFAADLYMANVIFVDGQWLPITNFGENVGGVWTPKPYAGSYGTNGFHLAFADSGMRGRDYSGNGNHWTPVNF